MENGLGEIVAAWHQLVVQHHLVAVNGTAASGAGAEG